MKSYRIINEVALTERLPAWRTLVTTVSSQLVFMQPEYLISWMDTFVVPEKRALYGVVDTADSLVAILPFYWEGEDTLRLLGAADLSDYLDLIIDPDASPDLHTWIDEFIANDLGPWKYLKLESLPQTSPSFSFISTLADTQSWSLEQTQQDVCPVITLPSSWEDYLAALEPKSQQLFRRLERDIGIDDEITYRCLESSTDIAAAMDTFIHLHKASSQEKRSFWTPDRERFFTQMAVEASKENQVKLFFLDVDGQPAASLFVFEYQNQFLLYNSGYDAYRYGHLGVGNVLILHTIRQAISLGRSRYDFMRGDESYKHLFGTQPEPVFDLTLTR